MEDVQHHNQASHYQQNRNGQSDDQVDEVLICRCRNMLGKVEGRRRRGPQRMRWLDGITDSMEMSLGQDSCRVGTGESGLVFCGEMKLSFPLELFTR